MADEPQYRHYFLRTAALAAILVGGLTALTIAVVLNVRELDRVVILAFPLGYWLAAQGVILLAVIAAFWFAGRQEKLDRAYGATDES